jgi:N-acetylneuraminic acid mutarotase
MKTFILFILSFLSIEFMGQCTFTATIGANGPVTFCENDSLLLSTDALGNLWTQKSNFAGVARKRAVGFSIGNKAYIGTGDGGAAPLKDFWEYDPSTNTWTQKANFPGTGRFDAVGFSILNKGYIGTGESSGSPTSDFWEYDPSTNTWTQKANFPGTRTRATGFSIGNKGYMGTGGLTKDLYEYDPTTNTWTQKANMPTGNRYGCISFSIGNKGYVGGGYVNGGLSNDFWEFNPANNSWTQKANILTGYYSSFMSGFSIGTKGYVGLGLTPPGMYLPTDVFAEYDPLTNIWTARASLTGGARWGAVGFSIDGKGYLCTGQNSVSTLFKDVWEYSPTISGYSWSTGSTTSNTTVYTGSTYSVLITNVAGCTASASIEVSTILCLGIEVNSNQRNILAYPNPNNGNFYLDIPTTSPCVLLNSLGQSLEMVDSKAGKVYFENFPSGIYYLKSETATYKIIVLEQ